MPQERSSCNSHKGRDLWYTTRMTITREPLYEDAPAGVGRATQRSVIISFLLILMLGYMITRMFYLEF